MTYLDENFGAVSTTLPFGLMCIVAVFLQYFMPETKGQQLVDSPEELKTVESNLSVVTQKMELEKV